MSGRIFWTAKEKELLVKEAVKIQHTDPAFAGLPLLRIAQKTLPKERRREIISLSQVPWFEPMLVMASKANDAESLTDKFRPVEAKLINHDEDPYVPILVGSRALLSSIQVTQERHTRVAEQVRQNCSNCCDLQQQVLAVLVEIRDLLKQQSSAATH